MILVCFIPTFVHSNANLENLETLISNLEFSFSVIAVSETWTPIGVQVKPRKVKPRKLEGYQNYHGNRGSPIKSGCGFYVKEGIKFKREKILIMFIMIQIMNSNLLG